MNGSLRDQLLAAGLVSKAKATEAKQQQRQQRNKGMPDPRAAQAAAARQAEAAKQARDQELNRKAQEKADKKARIAQIRQLVEQHRIPRPDSDDYYNFIEGSRIRRLAVDASLRARIIGGELAIVRCDGRYELVPADVAERIRERDERAVMASMTSGVAPEPAPAQDDPYKDYVVPDDLRW